MDKKKPDFTEDRVKLLLAFCLAAAIMLPFMPKHIGQAGGVREIRSSGIGREPETIISVGPGITVSQGRARPRDTAAAAQRRTSPQYPWDETDRDLMADIEAAQRAVGAGVPAERRLENERVELFLETCLALIDKEVPLTFHTLLKHMEGCNMKVVADRDTWQFQPAAPSKGCIWPFSKILSEL